LVSFLPIPPPNGVSRYLPFSSGIVLHPPSFVSLFHWITPLTVFFFELCALPRASSLSSRFYWCGLPRFCSPCSAAFLQFFRSEPSPVTFFRGCLVFPSVPLLLRETSPFLGPVSPILLLGPYQRVLPAYPSARLPVRLLPQLERSCQFGDDYD